MMDDDLIQAFAEQHGVTRLPTITPAEAKDRALAMVIAEIKSKERDDSWGFRSGYIEPHVSKTPTRTQAIARFYSEGWSIIQCVKAFRTSPGAVSRALEAENVTPRRDGTVTDKRGLTPPDMTEKP